MHLKTTHETKRNYKCDSCGKKFTQSGSLNTHIKTTHEELRNYKFDSCGKFFTQSGNMKEHTKIVHEGQKFFNAIIVENPLVHQET